MVHPQYPKRQSVNSFFITWCHWAYTRSYDRVAAFRETGTFNKMMHPVLHQGDLYDGESL